MSNSLPRFLIFQIFYSGYISLYNEGKIIKKRKVGFWLGCHFLSKFHLASLKDFRGLRFF